MNLQNNPRFFWKHIHNLQKQSCFPSQMFLQEENGNDGASIANLFSKHFSSVYVKEEFNVPEYTMDTKCDLNNLEVSLVTLYEGIQNLKTKFSAGPDGIPSILLKKCVCSLSKPLLHLFNMSLSQGIFPTA